MNPNAIAAVGRRRIERNREDRRKEGRDRAAYVTQLEKENLAMRLALSTMRAALKSAQEALEI